MNYFQGLTRTVFERERESKSPPLNFLLKTLFSLVIFVSFFFVVNSPVYAIDPFSDNFDRTDGVVGNGWSGVTWTISSSKVVNSPTLDTEIFTNPGAEGAYSSGVAPSWTKYGTDGTWSEENTNKHGDSSAQKFVGGTTIQVGASPNSKTITLDNWYYFSGWVWNDGPGVMWVGRQNGRLPWISNQKVAATGAYQKVTGLSKAASTGTETIFGKQLGTTAQTFYLDDFSLKPLTFSSMFLTRLYDTANPIVGAVMKYNNGVGHAGVVASLDNPDNPQNWVMLYHDGAQFKLSKFLNQVETNLFSMSSAYKNGAELMEIRKNGTTYQAFYGGLQLGTDQTVLDDSIINNKYVGLFGVDVAQFDSFNVREYGSHYATPDFSNFGRYTYKTGQGVLSMEFDDGVAADYTITYPLLSARSLKAGFAIIRRYIGGSGYSTLTQLLEMQTANMEMMCHTLNHGADPADYNAFVQETEVGCEEERRFGLNIWSFAQSGYWVGTYNFDNVSDYGTPEELLLRQYFKAYMANIVDFDHSNPYYNLPYSHLPWGVKHQTGDAFSLSALEGVVNNVITNGYDGVLLFHSNNIGQPTYISLADFTAFLDYVKSKVDAGLLEVLTPTQHLFAQPISITNSNSNTTTSNTSNPNTHVGWVHDVMAGPNYVGLSSYIPGPDGIQFYISPNAHHDDVYVTVTKQSTNSLMNQNIPFPWAQGLNTASEIYNFNAVSAFNGYLIPEFDHPATVVLKYDPTKLNGRLPSQLRIAWYDTSSKKWRVLQNNTVVNPVKNTIANTTKNFSYFAVVYPNNTSVLGTSTSQELSVPALTPTQQLTPTPTQQLTIPSQTPKPKHCFWFICW